jgi:hypothetical protein
MSVCSQERPLCPQIGLEHMLETRRAEVLVCHQLACLSLAGTFRTTTWLVLKRTYEQLWSLGAKPSQLAATQCLEDLCAHICQLHNVIVRVRTRASCQGPILKLRVVPSALGRCIITTFS